MDLQRRHELEADIRRRCAARDFHGAVSAAVSASGYGSEVFELLLALHRNDADAEDVFARFAEEVWRGIEGFKWDSSFRTWAYVIARRVSSRHRARAAHRAAHETPWPEGSDLPALMAQVRTETTAALRSARRARLVELRDTLPPDDQTLLMLRVDRELAWIDLARVLHDGEADLDEPALKRETARLRKRYQLIREKLHEMARREGLA